MRYVNFEVSGYTTHANALAKGRAVLEKACDCDQSCHGVRLVILALESGRFAPAAVLTSDTQWLAGMLAQRGICVL